MLAVTVMSSKEAKRVPNKGFSLRETDRRGKKQGGKQTDRDTKKQTEENNNLHTHATCLGIWLWKKALCLVTCPKRF